MMTPILEFRDVTKVFDSRGGLRRKRPVARALSSFNLTVEPGEVVALVGESGAGKSTAGRLALGLERGYEGQVLYEETEIGSLSRQALRRLRSEMHLLFQDPYQSLHPGMRVEGIIGEALHGTRLPPAECTERVAESLEEVQLTPVDDFLHRYPHELSGGQRQRVAFARGLVGRPRLVVADEPVSMLDVSLQAGILALVNRLRDAHQISVLFITHDLAVARYVADRIAVMYRGRILEVGEAHHVVEHATHPYTTTLLRAVESVAAPPKTSGPFPPGGQPCARHGHCQGNDPDCREPDLHLTPACPNHHYAVHEPATR